MGRSGRPSVRRPESEWTKILQRYDESGLTLRAFCRQERVSPESLRLWRQKLSESDSSKFVELQPPSAVEASPQWELEVALPNGVQLRFRG